MKPQKALFGYPHCCIKKGQRIEKARLVDALATIGLRKGDRIRIKSNDDGTFSILPEKFGAS